ncbi:hypothetical protein GF412_01265 [Candidatus Micrarchaeota archaeon]|nr:hypothetical protein [Candidatus Micrarchaeota archaeon]MBD3417600.1 hypothetical protein [Candidatus Micrarchaeota archaeon]
MVRTLVLFLVLVGFVFSATSVDYCQGITSSGEYELTTDLAGVNDSNTWCIRILADNVTLDCAGHNLTGTGGAGTYTAIDFKARNITVKNCIITQYDYGIYGDSPNGSSVDNNTIFKNEMYNIYLDADYSELTGNTIYETPEGEICAYVSGDENLVSGNEVYNSGYSGLTIKGRNNTITDNTVYNNAESGLAISGYNNTVTGNTAYGNDWEYYEGGGFEIGQSAGNFVDGNTAYNNTNGFYIEGAIPKPPRPPAADPPSEYGTTFTNNHAYDNLIGLNFFDYNGTYTDNILEENMELDMLVGGDRVFGGGMLASELKADAGASYMSMLCLNTVERNTGSGARPIYYSHETVNLYGNTYSEVILCNATDSVVSGVTVSGSDTLDNNGMLLILSNGTSISDSTSQNNFMGFGVLATPDVTISGSNAEGSGFGILALMSENLEVSSFTSRNNKMNATAILDLLMGFLGGGLRAGETLRAPEPEFKEVGAGAVLAYSPRATISSSSFSDSTIGLALLMSDEATISGGSATNNDIFGYGMLESYAANFENTATSGNDGNLHDIFEGDVPGAYEDLQLLPLGAGVIDLSLSMIMPPTGSRGATLNAPTTCYAYSECDMAAGEICNFTSLKCEAGVYENDFNSVRSYHNNYGMVLLSRGHHLVDRCRIYDNNILGILDASYFERERATGYTPPSSPNQAITVRNTYLYRNGETMFSTLSDTFEEGGRDQWAEAFGLLDEALPKGIIELEFIEASPIYRMGILEAPTNQPHWSLDETTIGSGPSSVRVSVEDNATVVYLLSDTTLPTVDSIHLESEDLEVNVTAYLDIDPFGLGERISYNNKYFLIAGIGEDGGARAPVDPKIDEFTVHYGFTGGYDGSTMALYQLRVEETGIYCEEDSDCARGEFCWVEQSICKPDADRECEEDSDCADPDFPYCNGFECSQCEEDSDCSDCSKCDSIGRCGKIICFSDSDCEEGCECSMGPVGYGYCQEPRMGAEGACAGSLERPVVLRASVEEQELIMKAYWSPVEGQIHNETEQTIKIYNFTQKDRSKFIMDLLDGGGPAEARIDPENFAIYLDVYGLFAVYEGLPDDGDGDEPEYVCESDIDCPDCYYCSIGNNKCLPKSDIECGVPGTGCASGYECVDCACVETEEPEPECTSNNDCPGDEYCSDGECTPVECECGEVKDHECVSYECCSDEDCAEGELCRDNECIVPEEEEECEECDEPIQETEDRIDEAKEQGIDTEEVEELLDKAKEAKEQGDCENALRYAEAALAAANALVAEEAGIPPAEVVSTEVPSVTEPKMPNGKEVTEMQQNMLWFVLILLGLGLVGYWWFRNHYGK